MSFKKPTKIYLVRHGETDWNKARKLQGSTDIELNDTGRVQALLLNEEFKGIRIDAVYSSNLVRAEETAKIISTGMNLQVITDHGLKERQWGSLEGSKFDDLKEKYGIGFIPVIEEFHPEKSFLHQDLRQVESYKDALDRVLPVLHKIHRQHEGESVLVVSHGGILKGLLLYLKLEEYNRPYVSNTAYLHLEVHDTHIALIKTKGVVNHAKI